MTQHFFLDYRVMWELVQKFRNRFPFLGDQVEDQRHTNQTVACKIYSRVNNTPIAFASNHGINKIIVAQIATNSD
jgi:hypothetical protein